MGGAAPRGGREELPGRLAYVHEAELILADGGDPAAPGGAVTQALCGHWDHEGPCRWPHHNAIDTGSTPARFRTLFVAGDSDEQEIRARIDSALRSDDRWSAIASGPRPVVATERPLAERLGSVDHEHPCRLPSMAGSDPRADLHRYLQAARDALLWKLEGLSEYDVRRPMTPTGTNLLGLIKHVASVEYGYLGETFGRPAPEPLPWYEEGAEPNADMWATAEETREQIVSLYHRAWAHADATIQELPLDAPGTVPWFPEGRREVTLHRILVHVIGETNRHAGHADIVRELVDGGVGLRKGNANMALGDRDWWEGYRARLERAAREASTTT